MSTVLVCILWLLLAETSRSVTAHQDTGETKDPPKWLECRPRQGDTGTTIGSTHNSEEGKEVDLECVFRITASYEDIENMKVQQQTHCSGEFCVTAHVWRADPNTIPSETKEYYADVVELHKDESAPQNPDLTNTYRATATNNNDGDGDVDPILGSQQQSDKYVDNSANSYDDNDDEDETNNEHDDAYYEDDYYDDDYYDDEDETNNEHDDAYEEPMEPESRAKGTGGIGVGTMRYDAPWIQYGEDTAEQLLKLQELLRNPFNSGTYERAILYDTIGLSHFNHLPYSDGSQYVWEFYRAANAWREASRLLDELYQRDDDGFAGKQLAEVQHSLADLFLTHYVTDIPGMDHDPTLPQKKSRHFSLIVEEHVSRALQLFSSLLIDQLYEDEDDRWHLVSYASTYIQMSQLIILISESHGDSANRKSEMERMERMRDHAQRAVDLVQSQLQESSPQLPVNSALLDVGLMGLSFLGTAHARWGNTHAAIEAWEEVVSLYHKYHTRASHTEAHAAVLAQTYKDLAVAYLQAGSFAKAKESYRGAIETHQSLNLFNDDFTVSLDDEDGTDSMVIDMLIRINKEQLQQLESPTYDNMGLGGDEDNHESMNRLLDQAELHESLGSIYVSEFKMELAAFHFNKAIELYKQDAKLYGSDVVTNIRMADDIYILSDIYMATGEYKDSANAYDKAVDLYRDNLGGDMSHLQWNEENSETPFLIQQKDYIREKDYNKKPQVTKNIRTDATTPVHEDEEKYGDARLGHVVNMVDYEQAIMNATKANSMHEI
eukprot:CAMPEP_0198285086 /NCGR_PEP_ID=MMETSP1449-20131203/4401_1 /TAXON_ID=420275 /ORGANISM="Attheya septentrionalis, Strain CCMP2084" /LENGTH=776 /DNA_ID=CAMNT_0043982345 /DNA_START=109 /DNA_END=2439 /DNA_ORIENTATION=+